MFCVCLFHSGWITPIFDVQLSPKKALRAAMLKSRFADTILKAQQKTLLDHVMPLTFSLSLCVCVVGGGGGGGGGGADNLVVFI